MDTQQLIDWYIKDRPTYKRLANKVESFLIEVFEMQSIGYHIVTSRAKEIESLRQKSSSKKYTDPINEIQDFAGIRIITYVEDEIDAVRKVIEENFEIDLENSSNKSEALGVDKVGYQSVHYVASLKEDRLVLPEYQQYRGRCFEIQVRTILQHAWAEIEHDRNYKFTGKLPPDLSRRFKVLAGVLELADREFNDISNKIDAINVSVDEGAKTGDLDIPLSSTSLSQFIASRFKDLITDFGVPSHDTDGVLIDELRAFGIETLDQLNQIIPEDIESYYRASSEGALHEWGMIRSLMILKDYKKYLTVIPKDYDIWCNPEKHANLEFELDYFKKHGVDWKDIEENYGLAYESHES